LYAHASRILHQGTNLGCAKALFQRHGDRSIWVNLPAYPHEMDAVSAYFLPMANTTTIYHTEMNSLRNIKNKTDVVPVSKWVRERRLYKAILRYHDAAGWPMIRQALRKMGKANLIDKDPNCLAPEEGRDEKTGKGGQ
jgi:radical SAM superfamily enzyme YgiQ (UPF0313 family)